MIFVFILYRQWSFDRSHGSRQTNIDVDTKYKLVYIDQIRRQKIPFHKHNNELASYRKRIRFFFCSWHFSLLLAAVDDVEYLLSMDNAVLAAYTLFVNGHGENRFRCPLCCNVQYTQVRFIRSHIKECGQQFVCEICHHCYKQKRTYQKHMREKHQVEKHKHTKKLRLIEWSAEIEAKYYAHEHEEIRTTTRNTQSVRLIVDSIYIITLRLLMLFVLSWNTPDHVESKMEK